MAEAGQALGGRYRLDEPLKAGGFGQVWRGFDQILERSVAVKLLLGARAGDTRAERLFEREARLAAQLVHPSITIIFDYGVEDPPCTW